MRPRSVIAIAFVLLPLTARADTLTLSTGSVEGTVNGLRNGKISLTLKTGVEKQFDLSDVTTIALDATPAFAQAEAVREDDLKATALYKSLIATLNKPDLKLLAEARAIDPTDRNGRWSDAVALFLDVYQAQPTEAAWKLRPMHYPEGTSKLLTESASRIADAVKTARTDEAKQNLRRFLLDIYIRAGDTASAERVSRELKGVADDPTPAPSPPAEAGNATLAVTVSQLEATLRAGNFDQVIRQVDANLAATGPAGDATAMLFSLKARALEAQNKLDAAAATWLRIPTYFPNSALAPNALLRAAALQEKLQHPDESKALLEEIRTAYPDSPEATRLKP